MATLTGRGRSLQRDRDRRNKLKNSVPANTAVYNPAPTGTLNAAQMMGASGRGADPLPDAVSEQIKTATEAGVPMAGLGDTNSTGKTNLDRPKGYVEPRLSAEQAEGFAKSFGLSGLVDSKKFAGMTSSEANKALLAEKQKKQSQVTAGTSAVFNTEVSGKTKRAIDQLGFALNDITNSPFNGKTSKLKKTEGLIESTGKQLAKLFKTPEEFNQAYTTNQTFKDAIDRFQKFGGKADSVTSSIVPPPETTEPGVQTTADFLSTIRNPLANQEAEQKAINELIPERDVDQAEIARQAGIADQMRKFYMGDEATVGLLKQQELNAKEEIRINEQEEKDDKNSLKAKAKHAIAKNKAEVEVESAKIEQNRLAAKNYMTGYLAKLGALNTTGAAGLAIQTLDTKYEMAVSELKTTAKYANQELELNLVDDINKVETDTDKEILKIQQDLTKTTEDVFKEVTKVQQAADKEIYNITAGYTKTFRERTAKHTQDLKDAAEKYAKEFAKTASNGIDFTAGGLPTTKSKIVSTIEKRLKASRGSKDGHVNSETYTKAYEEWVDKGGTMRTFKNAFPPADWVNPDDYSLIPALRYAKESQTLPKETADEEDFSTN